MVIVADSPDVQQTSLTDVHEKTGTVYYSFSLLRVLELAGCGEYK